MYFSIYIWMWLEFLEVILVRVSKYGYKSIEFVGEFEKYLIEEIID